MNKKNIVFTSANYIEAGIVRGVLESNGIDVHTLDENISRIQPLYNFAVRGVKLAVPDHQIEEAKTILKEWGKTEDGKKLTGQVSPFEFLGKTEDKNNRIITLLLSLLMFPLALFAWLGFNTKKK